MWALQKIQALNTVTGKDYLNINKLGDDSMKKMSSYADGFLKDKKGLFNDGNKEKITAAVESFKNLPEVQEQISKLDVLTQVYGSQNATVKKITESLNKELERVSNGPNSTTPQNSTLTVNHNLITSSIMDGINKEVMKNPTAITEWGHKSDYTTPKLAANSKK
jgi:hypothetical protein